jgi:hypothetical protein
MLALHLTELWHHRFLLNKTIGFEPLQMEPVPKYLPEINATLGGALGVREHQSAFQLVFQDAVFGGQIFRAGSSWSTVPVTQARRRPIHNGLFAPIPDGADRLKKCTGTPLAPLCWPPTTDRPISRFSFLTLRRIDRPIEHVEHTYRRHNAA